MAVLFSSRDTTPVRQALPNIEEQTAFVRMVCEEISLADMMPSEHSHPSEFVIKASAKVPERFALTTDSAPTTRPRFSK